MEYKDKVPKCFWHNSEPTPIAYTVGELIDELRRLPRELEVSTGFNTGAMVCLYNIDNDGMHVEIIEVEPEDDDDWPDDEDIEDEDD